MTDTIRSGVATDLERLVEIENAVFAPPAYEPMSARQFAYHLENPRAKLLVAESDGSVVGYALGMTRSRSRFLRFYSLAVAPQAQGGSVGRSLFAAIEAAARDRGLGVITEVREDNAKLHRRYLSLGYSVFEHKADYYPDGCTAIRMKKSFSGAS